ncbi:MAG: VWA domain-containing protein [Terracidiphilus sp.]
MKWLVDFRLHWVGAFTLACAAVGFAQQTPAPAPAQTTPAQTGPAQNAPAQQGSAQQVQPQQAPAQPVAEPAQQNQAPGSFVVDPGPLDLDDAPVTIRSTTRRVVVDVVVTGPDGKPVSGLTQQDFNVLEDRKPQSVRAFEVHTPEEDRSQLPPGPSDLPSHTFMNLEQTPASGPPVVILLDYLNTPVNDQWYAHEQIVKFLEHKPASTEVAIFALSEKLSLMQGFTTDTARLLAAMRSKDAGLHLPAASDYVIKAQTTLDAFLDMGRFLTTIEGRKNLLWFSESFNMLVLPDAHDVEQGAIFVDQSTTAPSPTAGPVVTSANLIPSAAAGSEASSSGFSNRIGDMTVLQAEMRKVATALAVSQTAVYPIDVRGLVVDPGFSAAASGTSPLTANPKGITGTPGMPPAPGAPPAAVQSHNDFMSSLNGTQATMQEIAESTGGHAFVNTNGIAAAAAAAVTDGSEYYTLVYAPSNLKFDGGLRAIHVTLNKPGYSLAYRSAYYAVDPATVTPDAAVNDNLAAAMVHGGPEAQGLVFKAQIDPNGAPAMAAQDSPMATKAAYNGAKKNKKPEHLSGMVQPYTIRLAILAKGLQMTPLPDGQHRAVLQIAVYAYSADGQKLGGMRQNLEASLPPKVYEYDLQNGMFHNMQVELPVEAASLRLAIFDPGSHNTGSLEVALPLPPAQQADAGAERQPAAARQ